MTRSFSAAVAAKRAPLRLHRISEGSSLRDFHSSFVTVTRRFEYKNRLGSRDMCKTQIMKAAFVAFVSSLSMAAQAIAEGQSFHVPPGDLVAALESFAKQANVDLVYQDAQ